MLSQEWLEEIRVLSPEAREMTEAGLAYLYLPGLKLPKGCDPQVVDALLCLQPRDGYATRLFLSARLSTKPLNWGSHRILDREWYTWSWKDVSANMRPVEILLGHLRALR
jgi:hypothetical protein